MHLEGSDVFQLQSVRRSAKISAQLRNRADVGSLLAGDRLRTVMSSIMRRRRGLKSPISMLLSEGDGLQHPHPLSQEAIYATLPRTPRRLSCSSLIALEAPSEELDVMERSPDLPLHFADEN